MLRPSVQITAKMRSALGLLSAISTQGPVVVDALREKFRKSLEADVTSFASQVDVLQRLLRTALDAMSEADAKLLEASIERTTRYEKRQAHAARLGQRVQGLRKIVEGYHGDDAFERLDVAGPTPREPVALLRHAEHLREALQRDDIAEVLGEAAFANAIDLAQLGQQLEAFESALQTAYDQHLDTIRRVDELRNRRNEATKAFDVTYLRVARQFEDLCFLASLDELATKVRPSRRGKAAETAPNEDETSKQAEAPHEDLADVPVLSSATRSITEPETGYRLSHLPRHSLRNREGTPSDAQT